MKIIAITGPPLGGKSTLAQAIRDHLKDMDVGLISTGKLAKALALKMPNPHDMWHLRLLDYGLMFPNQTDIMEGLKSQIMGLDAGGTKCAIVDGAPRFGSHVGSLNQMAELLLTIIVQPSHGIIKERLSVVASGGDTHRVWMQPQREALWYGHQFHEIVAACCYLNSQLSMCSDIVPSPDLIKTYADWLKG